MARVFDHMPDALGMTAHTPTTCGWKCAAAALASGFNVHCSRCRQPQGSRRSCSHLILCLGYRDHIFLFTSGPMSTLLILIAMVRMQYVKQDVVLTVRCEYVGCGTPLDTSQQHVWMLIEFHRVPIETATAKPIVVVISTMFVARFAISSCASLMLVCVLRTSPASPHPHTPH